MPDTKTSAVPFDDFVKAVRSDPAQSEPLIVLAGYVGKSDTEGNVRIYSDASLNAWYEAAEDDVVHARPIADSPLGGSNLWLRATATLTPGAAAPPKPEPKDGEEGEADVEAAPPSHACTPAGITHFCSVALCTHVGSPCPTTDVYGCPSTSTCPPQAVAAMPTMPECTIMCVTRPPFCPPHTVDLACFPTVSGVCLPYTMGGCTG